jgi:hypothetical protein
MPVAKSNLTAFLMRAQQYTVLAQRADCSLDIRRAFARRAAQCLALYDAAERQSAGHADDDGETEPANKAYWLN